MSFLDNQKKIDTIFGKSPVILMVNPITGSPSECLKKARIYVDKCMFGVFLHICKDDYVKNNDARLQGKLIHEIWKSITKLRQDYMLGEV